MLNIIVLSIIRESAVIRNKQTRLTWSQLNSRLIHVARRNLCDVIAFMTSRICKIVQRQMALHTSTLITSIRFLGGYTNGYISVLFFTLLYHISFSSLSLLFPLTIPVIENSQIDAIMCVISCETKLNFS